ncbi:transcriptional regulator [Fusarium beomiforme]|uniref:Transcriptional regulator n=1 Tax=Fusarium beomiforme TaxID=44412 RepID=A0A9P5DUX7_9HYPO|nr:transcriptional regulator [Fusarium beomiforme]
MHFNDSSSLSLRMSCDRCRVQKVKCSVSAGAKACQRCTRARVSCTFGRRTPSKRSSRRVETATRPPSPPPTASSRRPATPPPTSRLASSSVSANSSASPVAPPAYPAATPDTQLDALMATEPMSSAAAELELSSCSGLNTSWECSAVELYGFDSDMDMAAFDWLDQSAFAIDQGNTEEMDRSDPTQWSHVQPSTAAVRLPTDSIAAVNPSANSIGRSSNVIAAGQRLTALVPEIQQQLRRLEEGPWHTDSAHSLHDYPVGTILELSQQFSTITGTILTSNVCVNNGVEEAGSDEDSSENAANCFTSDTPTMLLIICGYIWLVQTYSVVLGHFQKHLHRIPTADPRHVGTVTCVISPIASSTSTKFRLGELPCTDVAMSLQQIHTAVRMLLDVLHEIEGHLGRGAVGVCDMAATLLLSFGKPQNGSARDLGIKAAAVKKLLREKMGL